MTTYIVNSDVPAMAIANVQHAIQISGHITKTKSRNQVIDVIEKKLSDFLGEMVIINFITRLDFKSVEDRAIPNILYVPKNYVGDSNTIRRSPDREQEKEDNDHQPSIEFKEI